MTLYAGTPVPDVPTHGSSRLPPDHRPDAHLGLEVVVVSHADSLIEAQPTATIMLLTMGAS